MRKTIITLFLAVVASVGTISAEVYSGTCGTNLNWTLDTETRVLNITGSGAMTNWYSYSNKPWESLSSFIETIIIEEGVTSIGKYAFVDCRDLTSVTIPESVASIYANVFSNCTNLTSVIWNARHCRNYSDEAIFPTTITSFAFGDNVEFITECVCMGMTELTNIKLNSSVTSIGDNAFFGCISLTSIEIPNSVTSIGARAFSCCSLTSIEIPNSVTSIGDGAFGISCFGGTVAPITVTLNSNAIVSKTYSIDGKGSYHNIGDMFPQTREFIIGNDVTSIGANAFNGDKKMTVIQIPNSVTSIGRGAFSGCEGLTSVIIPNSVTSIGERAFSGCSGLTSVTIPNSVTSIGDYAFYKCTGLTSVTIPNSVTSIGEEAFYECTGLTSVTIPNSVTSIGDYAFYKCTGLTSVAIPNSVDTIRQYTFYNCGNLTSVTIGNSVKSIGDGAFYGCSGLTSVVWNATNCEDFSWDYSYDRSNSPFYSVRSQITSFTFGDNVEHIPDYLCYGMENLIDVKIPNSVTSIGDYAFDGCGSIRLIDGIYYVDTYLLEAEKDITSCNIKEGTRIISEFAFYNCENITSVTIPSSVISIGIGAFKNCEKLDSVHISDIAAWCGIKFGYVEKNNPMGWHNNSNPLYYAHHLYLNDTEITDLIIPDGVTSIGNNTFYNCYNLTSVTIPNSVTCIGNNAFYDCQRLTSILIPNKVTSIGDNAFCFCLGLTSVILSNNLSSIGNNAFYYCENLTSITIPNSVSSIGEDAFYRVLNVIYSGIANGAPWGALNLNGHIDGDLVLNEDKTKLIACSRDVDGEIIIPNSVTCIGERAFDACIGLTSITIPSSVTSIEKDAFYCPALSSVHISDMAAWCRIKFENLSSNPLHYPYYSYDAPDSPDFYQNETLITNLEIPDGVTGIGDYAFPDCNSLVSITMPNSVTSIGNSAFYNCRNLSSVNLGYGVKSIGSGAFQQCYGLKTITIPSSVTSIGDDAFYWKRSFEFSVVYESELTSVTLNSDAIAGKTYTSESNLSAIFGPKVKEYNIGKDVTKIGEYAFSNCTAIEKLYLGENITTYGDYAFTGCTGLTSIYNYRVTPAKLGADAFKDVDYFNSTLYVLAGSVDMYKSTGSDWKDFYFVESIGADGTVVETVQITPYSNTADMAWPKVEGAASYELIVRDVNEEEICSLVFNAQGQLTSIAFHAPSRNRMPQQTSEQVAGFSFTVTGLERASKYGYTINSLDANGQIIDTKTGSFVTDGYTEPNPPTQSYTVTFFNWNGDILDSQIIEEGHDAVAPANPTREGYTFIGWDIDFTNVQSDLAVTALYAEEDIYFTVLFTDWDGTILKQETVREGESATPPTNPNRDGYSFDGWSDDYTNVQSDLTIVAEYSVANTNFTVIFIDWDGTVLKRETVEKGENATPPAAPQRDGYTFSNWKGDFTNVQSNKAVIAVYNGSELDGTIEKCWTIDEAITVNGISDEVKETIWDTEAVVAKLLEEVLTSMYQTYAAADVTFNFTYQECEGVTTVMACNDQGNIYEQEYSKASKCWEFVKEEIVNGLPSSQTEYYWDHECSMELDKIYYQLQNPNMTCSYKEVCIYSEDACYEYDGGEIQCEDDITYYTVRFVDWDETVLKKQTVEKGKNATAPDDPVRTGYKFIGWDKDYTNVQSDLTIMAQYKIKTFTVRFLDWNDTELKVETVEYGKSATAPEAPTREGYTFKGWDTEFDNVKSNLDVKAVYKQNQDEAIEEINSSNSQTVKLIKHGNFYILRNGEMYNAQGARVK